MLDPRAAAAELTATAGSRPAAALFGNESNGLSNEDLAACHALLNIPANPEYESLNLAQGIRSGVSFRFATTRPSRSYP